MDRDLFQTALRVLQQINKRLPVAPEDAAKLKECAPPEFKGEALDLIAVEIVQRGLRKKSN